MASTALLRCWGKEPYLLTLAKTDYPSIPKAEKRKTKGQTSPQTGGRLLFSSKLVINSSPELMKSVVPCKGFKMTPCSSGALDYFRARRGPFTPEEKQGTGHLMFTSQHWKMERIVAVSMIGIMPAALFFQNPTMDFLLSTSVFLHGFWGFDHVLSDYVQKFVPFIHYVWYVISIMAFAGLMHFNYNDVGVTKAIQMLWRV